MTIASIFKRSRPSIGAHSADGSIKFERTGQHGIHDRTALGTPPAASFSGVPVILRSILLPLHASGLSRIPEPHISGDVMINKPSIFSRVRRSAKQFRRADSGNVAVLFAFTILPILGFVGAAIDYSRVNNARTAMQSALDTAALMISKDADGMNAADINKKATDYFTALYKQHPEAQNVAIAAAYTNSSTAGSKVVLTGSASMQTDFMRVVGYPTLDFGVSATTVWGT
ncbi:MAG: TadE/TadG family type IV pilus assembly protein, partial [Pseudomonadota bacterium]